MNPFPIPVVAAAVPGVDDPAPEYLAMPGDMATFAQPQLDDPVETGALEVLSRLLERMRAWPFGAPDHPVIDALTMDQAVRTQVNDALGEGEVSIVIRGERPLRIQETVFAGVWRLQQAAPGGGLLRDEILACALPGEVIAGARGAAVPAPPAAEPAGLMNGPAVLAEIVDRARHHRPGDEAHIVNLTLLPMSPADRGYLAEALGEGAVAVLSRGYGNCRVSSTALAHTWWVRYFNSVDQVILDTLEVTDVPDVVPAAAEDFADSIDRLAEWIAVLSGGAAEGAR